LLTALNYTLYFQCQPRLNCPVLMVPFSTSRHVDLNPSTCEFFRGYSIQNTPLVTTDNADTRSPLNTANLPLLNMQQDPTKKLQNYPSTTGGRVGAGTGQQFRIEFYRNKFGNISKANRKMYIPMSNISTPSKLIYITTRISVRS